MLILAGLDGAVEDAVNKPRGGHRRAKLMREFAMNVRSVPSCVASDWAILLNAIASCSISASPQTERVRKSLAGKARLAEASAQRTHERLRGKIDDGKRNRATSDAPAETAASLP
jgi:hypothetical protein